MEAHIFKLTAMQFMCFLKVQLEQCEIYAMEGNFFLAGLVHQQLKNLWPMVPLIIAGSKREVHEKLLAVVDGYAEQLSRIRLHMKGNSPSRAFRNATQYSLN